MSGPLMSEAQRQLNSAFPDAAMRLKVLKSLFGTKLPSWDNDGEMNVPALQMGVHVLVAPAPISMVQNDPESSPTLSIPQQQSMFTAPTVPSEEEKPWWGATVTQVFTLWSTDPWAESGWNVESVNQLR